MNLALNNLQWLICHKSKINQIKPNQANIWQLLFCRIYFCTLPKWVYDILSHLRMIRHFFWYELENVCIFEFDVRRTREQTSFLGMGVNILEAFFSGFDWKCSKCKEFWSPNEKRFRNTLRWPTWLIKRINIGTKL